MQFFLWCKIGRFAACYRCPDVFTRDIILMAQCNMTYCVLYQMYPFWAIVQGLRLRSRKNKLVRSIQFIALSYQYPYIEFSQGRSLTLILTYFITLRIVLAQTFSWLC